MKLYKILFILFPVLAIIVGMQSCDDSKKGECENKISQSGGDDSHNNGSNCMTCHFSGGTGEGCFTVAGSVYDSLQTNPVGSGSIRLFTGPNGTGNLVATLHVDGKGNFYTTDQVNFNGGLFPSYADAGGKAKFMSTSTPSGQCGSCHGVSTGKIFAP